MEQNYHAQASDNFRWGRKEARYRVNGFYLEKVQTGYYSIYVKMKNCFALLL